MRHPWVTMSGQFPIKSMRDLKQGETQERHEALSGGLTFSEVRPPLLDRAPTTPRGTLRKGGPAQRAKPPAFCAKRSVLAAQRRAASNCSWWWRRDCSPGLARVRGAQAHPCPDYLSGLALLSQHERTFREGDVIIRQGDPGARPTRAAAAATASFTACLSASWTGGGRRRAVFTCAQGLTQRARAGVRAMRRRLPPLHHQRHGGRAGALEPLQRQQQAARRRRRRRRRGGRRHGRGGRGRAESRGGHRGLPAPPDAGARGGQGQGLCREPAAGSGCELGVACRPRGLRQGQGVCSRAWAAGGRQSAAPAWRGAPCAVRKRRRGEGAAPGAAFGNRAGFARGPPATRARLPLCTSCRRAQRASAGAAWPRGAGRRHGALQQEPDAL